MQCLDVYPLETKDIYFNNDTGVPIFCYVQDYGDTRWILQPKNKALNSSNNETTSYSFDEIFDEVVVPNTTLGDIVQSEINLIKRTKYHLFSYNCHFISTSVRSIWTLNKTENMKYLKLIKEGFKTLKFDENIMRTNVKQ